MEAVFLALVNNMAAILTAVALVISAVVNANRLEQLRQGVDGKMEELITVNREAAGLLGRQELKDELAKEIPSEEGIQKVEVVNEPIIVDWKGTGLEDRHD